jgi:hypothetical protein
MGAPIGNKNAAGPRDKLIADALRKQLIQYEDGTVNRGEAAQQIAKNVIKLALKDNEWAISFLADRVDGKPTQGIEHSGRVITESISEEHARLVAEGYLESIRRDSGDSAKEPDRLHDSVSPGLPGSTATP